MLLVELSLHHSLHKLLNFNYICNMLNHYLNTYNQKLVEDWDYKRNNNSADQEQQIK